MLDYWRDLTAFERRVALATLGAALFVILRLALINPDERFPGGAAIGEVLNDLAVGLIVTAFFYEVVARRPAQERRQVSRRLAHPSLVRAVGRGRQVAIEIMVAAEASSVADPMKLLGLCNSLPAETVGGVRSQQGDPMPLWFSIVHWVVMVEDQLKAAEPFLQDFEIDLQVSIKELRLTDLWVAVHGSPRGRQFAAPAGFAFLIPSYVAAIERLAQEAGVSEEAGWRPFAGGMPRPLTGQ
jgi:hypothetical protein